MPEWIAVLLAGAIGGLVNEYLSEGGFAAPRRFADAKGRTRLDPGVLGAVVVGALTGIAFWGLYNPSASFASTRIEVRPVIGALLAGVGGSRVLTGFVEGYISEKEIATTAKAVDEGTSSALDQGDSQRE